jgi:hypothetical protein
MSAAREPPHRLCPSAAPTMPSEIAPRFPYRTPPVCTRSPSVSPTARPASTSKTCYAHDGSTVCAGMLCTSGIRPGFERGPLEPFSPGPAILDVEPASGSDIGVSGVGSPSCDAGFSFCCAPLPSARLYSAVPVPGLLPNALAHRRHVRPLQIPDIPQGSVARGHSRVEPSLCTA